MARRRNNAQGGYRRGDDSRQRIVEAALDVFGHYGFDGATTRRLAEAAEVNLAAIPYYFGGKEGLYRAVAEHVLENIRARQAPFAAKARQAAADPDLAPGDALTLLLQLLDGLAAMVLGAREADRWAHFMIREQMDPTPAFEILYAGFLEPMHRLCSTLVARVRGLEPDDPDAVIAASTLIGQIMVFRAARATVLRRLGWDGYSENRIEQVKAVVRRHARAILGPDAEEATS